MRVVANSIPKSGTHLLDRLLTLLGFDLMDLGGIRPHLAQAGKNLTPTRRRLRALVGLRRPEDVMGIGSHLADGGRFPPARRLLRTRGPEKVMTGVDFPREIGRRWLKRRLSRVPDRCFVTAHCVYSPELASLFAGEQMRVVCILRDPRDVAVSQMHYIKQRQDHFAHEAFLKLPSDRERLLHSIQGGELGGRRLQSLDERYRQFLGWQDDENAIVVKFEDLVGPRGGGSAEAQRRTVERVARHLGVWVHEETVSSIEEDLFGLGRTFRKGKIGGWRSEFCEEHVQAAREIAGPLLVKLGYEADPHW
jgi:Sulfotransferase domain